MSLALVFLAQVSRIIFQQGYFQMSIKCPTSGGQTRDQEAAVQQTFHFDRSSFCYLSGKDST